MFYITETAEQGDLGSFEEHENNDDYVNGDPINTINTIQNTRETTRGFTRGNTTRDEGDSTTVNTEGNTRGITWKYNTRKKRDKTANTKDNKENTRGNSADSTNENARNTRENVGNTRENTSELAQGNTAVNTSENTAEDIGKDIRGTIREDTSNTKGNTRRNSGDEVSFVINLHYKRIGYTFRGGSSVKKPIYQPSKKSTLKGKNLLPKGSKFFSFRVDSFSKRAS